jgi:hypothetical protein
VPFSLQVAGDSGPFTPGKADIDLRLHAYSWTTGEIDEPSVNQVVSLKGSK